MRDQPLFRVYAKEAALFLPPFLFFYLGLCVVKTAFAPKVPKQIIYCSWKPFFRLYFYIRIRTNACPLRKGVLS